MNNIQKILLIFLSISVGKTMVAMRGDQNERFKEGISNQIASIYVGVVTKETFFSLPDEQKWKLHEESQKLIMKYVNLHN